MSFRKKIFVTLCIGSAGALIVTVIAWYVFGITKNIVHDFQIKTHSNTTLLRVTADINYLGRLARNIMLGDDFDKNLKSIEEYSQRVLKALDSMEAESLAPELRSSLISTRTEARKFCEASVALMETYRAVPAHMRHLKMVEYGERNTPIANAFRAAFQNFESTVNASLTRSEAELQQWLARAELWCLGLALLVALGVLGLGYTLSRRDFAAMDKCTALAKGFGQGALEARILPEEAGSLGELARALNETAGSLHQSGEATAEALRMAEKEKRETEIALRAAESARQRAEENQRAMVETADELTRIATALNATAQELFETIGHSREGATAQAESLSKALREMQGMDDGVREMAQRAARAAEGADEARSQASHGAGVVAELLQGMETVRGITGEMGSCMQELGQEVDSITGVMNIISDIADQTNLLALNAAIEAARAGEAGRGFAVVADEVRKLAEKTMQATHEVGRKVQGIQNTAKRNMTNAEQSVLAVDKTTALAGNSDEALRTIVTFAGSSAAEVHGIALQSENNKQSGRQVTEALCAVNDIAATTETNMHSAARQVSEMTGKAKSLHELVQRLHAPGK